MLTNGVWGLIALVAIFAIIFVKAGSGQAGRDGGEQAATIIKAAGGSGSTFISALEGGGYTGSLG